MQGKYVEIQFSRGGEPEGGVIYNFLLEKVGWSVVLRPVSVVLCVETNLYGVSC